MNNDHLKDVLFELENIYEQLKLLKKVKLENLQKHVRIADVNLNTDKEILKLILILVNMILM